MIDYSISVRPSQPGTKKSEVTETKAYGIAQVSEILTMNQFARHIAAHGSVYSRGDVHAILVQTVDCLKEMLLEGKKIQLGELGSFSVALRTSGAKDAASFGIQHIHSVRVNWQRGPAFRDLKTEATFNLVASRQAQQEALTKLKATNASTPAPTPGGESGSGNTGGGGNTSGGGSSSGGNTSGGEGTGFE